MEIDNIGAVIRYHRKAAGLSQLELANYSGVGKTVIYDIEKEKDTIQFSTLKKVCLSLNIELKWNSRLKNQYIKDN